MNPLHEAPCSKNLCPFLLLFFLLLLLTSGCETTDYSTDSSLSKQRGEYIGRLDNESLEIPSFEKIPLPRYPWKQTTIGKHPKINKEYFRCKGNHNNPTRMITQNGAPLHVADCGGIQDHSLPLRNGKEFIYPILINLLNYVQLKTNHPVIITSGHRCPEHNRYNDATPSEQYSKHLMGAEVSFYVQEMQTKPEIIIKILQQYFLDNPIYRGQPEYQEFKRWEKGGGNCSTLPWYNKEVFIKLYQSNEGRSFDNRHGYPYISIQVRYDRERKDRVAYSWDQAFRNYWRW